MNRQERRQFLRDRKRALTNAILKNDMGDFDEYCRKYKVPMSKNPTVRRAAACKAACHCTDIPEDVKAVAREVLHGLGMTEDIT